MCSQTLEHFKQTDVHWHNFDCSFSPIAAKLREIYCDTKFSVHMNEYRTNLVKKILNHVLCENFRPWYEWRTTTKLTSKPTEWSIA